MKDVAKIVGPPILGHKVVTLSREIHAGLLATEAQRPELEQLGITWIELVCVDLYPLPDEIKRHGSTPESVLEMTDIGGPTLLRSAAKGRRIVIGDPADRAEVLRWIRDGEPSDRHTFIAQLAANAEANVAVYRLPSAVYHGQGRLAGLIASRADPWHTVITTGRAKPRSSPITSTRRSPGTVNLPANSNPTCSWPGRWELPATATRSPSSGWSAHRQRRWPARSCRSR